LRPDAADKESDKPVDVAQHAVVAGAIVKLTSLPRPIAALTGPIAARHAAALVGYGPTTSPAWAISQPPSLGTIR